MDILKMTPSERVVEIVSPGKKEPIGVRVTLVHIDDDRLKKLRRSIQDNKSRLESKGKYFKSDDIESNTFELTFATMTGWEWYNPTGAENDANFDKDREPTLNGERNPAFNKKNVFQVFEKLPWFLEYIGKEVGDDESFFQV